MKSLLLILAIIQDPPPQTDTVTQTAPVVASQTAGTTSATTTNPPSTPSAPKKTPPKPKPKPTTAPLDSATPPKNVEQPIISPGWLAVHVGDISLQALPMPDGSVSLRPLSTLASQALGTLGEGAVVMDQSGRQSVKWSALSQSARKEVTTQLEAFSERSTLHALAQQQKRMSTALITLEGAVARLRDGRDPIILWITLTLAALVTGWFLRERRSIMKTVRAAEEYYAPQQNAKTKWTIDTWLRQSYGVHEARKSLREREDRRNLRRFVDDAIQTQTGLHRLLFGSNRAADWARVSEELDELVIAEPGNKVLALELTQETVKHGLICEIDALQKKVEGCFELEKKYENLRSLARACELEDESDKARIDEKAARARDALSMVNKLLAAGVSDPEEKLSQLNQELATCKSARDGLSIDLDDTNHRLDEEKRARAAAQVHASAVENRANRLIQRLELPGDDGADAAPIDEILSGEAWTDRLYFLATKESWNRLIIAIPTPLADLLKFSEIPDAITAALAVRSRFGTGYGGREPLWQLYDHFVRILEFHTAYGLTELEPLRPRLELACSVLLARMDSIGIACSRPKLLTDDIGEFVPQNFDEGVRRDERIAQCIRRELKSHRDFIVDITQSEIRQGGQTVRDGTCVIVNPATWSVRQ